MKISPWPVNCLDSSQATADAASLKAFSQARGTMDMAKSVLLTEIDALNRLHVRRDVARIPEVSLRIREAQTIADKIYGDQAPLLIQTMLKEDQDFKSSGKLSLILWASSQLGLWDRYLKTQRAPRFVICKAENIGLVKIMNSEIRFNDWISALVQDSGGAAWELSTEEPNSYLMIELRKDEKDGAPVSEIKFSTGDLASCVQFALDEFRVSQCVRVGFETESNDLSVDLPFRERFDIVNSIDLDPLLTWFMNQHRGGKLWNRAAHVN